MEGGGCESLLVDIGEGPTESTVRNSEKIIVGRLRLELRDERESVQSTAVVVELSLNALQFATYSKSVQIHDTSCVESDHRCCP